MNRSSSDQLPGGAGSAGLTGVMLGRTWAWPGALRALRFYDYRLMWSGALVSNIGTWMQTMAQGWLMWTLTRSALWVGIDAAAADIPVALLLPLGGICADRFDRRRTLIATNAAAGSFALILAILVWTHRVQPWMVVGLSLCVGCSDALRLPANQSLVPALVGREDVPNAIALNAIQFNASRVLGPGLGGLALLFGIGWCFFINALSFLGVIAAMLLLRNPPALRPVRESMGQSLRTGMGYVLSRADLLIMLSLVVIGGLTGGVISRLQPVIVAQVFHGARNAFVVFQVCFGIGAVLGAALVAYGTRAGLMSPWRAFVLMTVMAGCVFALGWGGPPWLGAATMMLVGMLFVASMVRLNGSVLNSTPADMQGRVSSFPAAFRCWPSARARPWAAWEAGPWPTASAPACCCASREPGWWRPSPCSPPWPGGRRWSTPGPHRARRCGRTGTQAPARRLGVCACRPSPGTAPAQRISVRMRRRRLRRRRAACQPVQGLRHIDAGAGFMPGGSYESTIGFPAPEK
jgi:MFS family permease